MIEVSVFIESLTELMATFDKSLPDKAVQGYYNQVSAQLNTQEFAEAVSKALIGRYFPTPDELIGLAIGTIEERAEREWENIECLSVVGLKALNAIGGWWYVTHQCTQPAIARKDFIESYCRHAKGASRQDFELPDPIALLAPVQEREWSFLPIGTKRNKQTQQIETRWQEVYLDEASRFDEAFTDITDEIKDQWVVIYLDRYAARNLRLVDGIHTRAHEKVPSYWEQKARFNLEWLHDRARLYLKNLEGTDNEI
jgi:hypothetical protein